MQTVYRKDIVDALGFVGLGEDHIIENYETHIPLKRPLGTGFGIKLDDFGDMGRFFVALGTNAQYAEESPYGSGRHMETMEARDFAAQCQIDPLGGKIVLWFPGWELAS